MGIVLLRWQVGLIANVQHNVILTCILTIFTEDWELIWWCPFHLDPGKILVNGHKFIFEC